MKKILILAGDGIGPEILAQTRRVVDWFAQNRGVRMEVREELFGISAWKKYQHLMRNETWAAVLESDAILFGATGSPEYEAIPYEARKYDQLLRMRKELDLFINLRPVVGVPGSIAEGADFIVIRENTEGTYAGEGGFLRHGTPNEIATQGSVNTRFGVERCVRFAFELAASREAKRLTLVHKTNVLTFSGDLWQRTVDDVATEFPQVTVDYNHIDAACIYMVEQPGRYDVIVTDNLFGDILTDLAGAVAGGIGFAASANLNAARTGPSLFEPVHGAAHDIAGQAKANPLAAISSGALMLEFLGEADAAERIATAVTQYAMSNTEPASTGEIGDAIAGRV